MLLVHVRHPQYNGGMNERPPPSGPPASGPEPRRSPGAAIRITLGVSLAAYYLHALVAVVRRFPEALQIRIHADYVAPQVALLPHLPVPGGGRALTVLSWLVMAGLAIGGTAMVVNYRRGMQLGLVALGVSLVEDLLIGLPTSLALAMGWLRISFTAPPRLAEASAHVQELTPEAIRLGGVMVLAMALVAIAVKAGLLVWLRRYLATTRPSSGQ